MNKEEAIKQMRDSMGNWGLTQEFWEDVETILEQYAQQERKKAAINFMIEYGAEWMKLLTAHNKVATPEIIEVWFDDFNHQNQER